MHLHLSLLASFFSLFLSLLLLSPLSLAQLSPSFYATSCPSAISTVTNTIVSLAKKDNVVAPSTLRLILHDCLVEGCDGSILLSSTPGNKAERDAADNENLPQNSFNAIIAAKKAVEQVCPGVVSCADILALAARDVVVFLGGPSWQVPLGRLDGRVSTASSVTGRLPGANFDIKQLTDNFASVGLSVEDLVILSGAHTIGFSHCDQFKNRLYSFNSSVNVDPSMDARFAQQLQKKCPANGGDNFQEFDIITPFVFDNNYFKDLQAGKGLLFSDQVLFQDASTRATVQSMAASQQTFFNSFTASMIKMSSIGVKQGGNGEIRKDCTAVNAGGGSATPSVGGVPPPPPTIQPAPVTPPPPELAPPPSPLSPPPPKPVPSVSPPPPQPVPQVSPPPSNPVVPVLPPPIAVPLASPPPPPVPIAFPPPLPKPAPSPPQAPQAPVNFNPPPAPEIESPPPDVPANESPPPEAPQTPVDLNPPPAPEIDPSPPPAPPRGGITIPGIPGFTPPIHLPFPGFGGGPPPSSTSSSKAPKKNSRRL